MIKNLILKLMNGLCILLVIASIAVLFVIVTTPKGQVPKVCGYALLRVMTGSMEPTIPTDSLLVVKEVPVNSLKVGDVISFYSKDPALWGMVNTHRIIEIGREEGGYLFCTKGDANNVEDHYPTPEDMVLGKVIFSSLFLGKIMRLLSNPLIFIPLVLGPLAVLLIQSVYKSYTLAKQLAREEEEAALRAAIEEIKKKKDKEV